MILLRFVNPPFFLVDRWGTIGDTCNTMKERLSAEIKTRTTRKVKKDFEKLANIRRLNPADLQREAFDHYLASQQEMLNPKPAEAKP